MTSSKLGKINLRDIGKGFVVAILTSLFGGAYQLLNAGGTIGWAELQPVLLAALAAGTGYITKNLISNSEGVIAKKEPTKRL